jgi:hypothetical protein
VEDDYFHERSEHMHLRLPRSLALAAAIAAVALGALSQPAGAHGGPHDGTASRAGQLPPDTREQLREVRRATWAFRDVDAAKAAGYAPAPECADDPKYGGMGIHYANQKLIADGKLDITRPEILVYQPAADGGRRLGAVEYFQVDGNQDLATADDRPSLFGLPFDGPMLGHEPGMPIHYDLHVWLYKHNPAGTFAMWNPRVQCPA